MDAERRVQRQFRNSSLFSWLDPGRRAGPCAYAWFLTFPNRTTGLAQRARRIRAVRLDSSGLAPFRLAGAWQLTSDDPRFGGVSALAIDRGRIARVDRFGCRSSLQRAGPVDRHGLISDLPDGPGQCRLQEQSRHRGAAARPDGRGWWVAFESRDQLWLYDEGFRRALRAIDLGEHRLARRIAASRRWSREGGGLMLFPERAGRLFRSMESRAAHDADRPMAAAESPTPLRSARIGFLAVERRLTPIGFRNALVKLEQTATATDSVADGVATGPARQYRSAWRSSRLRQWQRAGYG